MGSNARFQLLARKDNEKRSFTIVQCNAKIRRCGYESYNAALNEFCEYFSVPSERNYVLNSFTTPSQPVCSDE